MIPEKIEKEFRRAFFGNYQDIYIYIYIYI